MNLSAVARSGSAPMQHQTLTNDENFPPNRAYTTRVSAVRRLSPHFLRITVTSPELRHFYAGGRDQRIKLLLPREDGSLPDLGLDSEPQPPMAHWYKKWRQLPGAERNPIRTYTARTIRPEAEKIDIDFATHGIEGPASAWAQSAKTGDQLVIIGPDTRSHQSSGGIEFSPGTAKDLLVAGDETAVPAICAILETLPPGFRGEAYLEVPSHEDVLDLRCRSAVEIHWLPRTGTKHGSELIPAVHRWGERKAEQIQTQSDATQVESGKTGVSEVSDLPEVPDDITLWETSQPDGIDEYAWLAGEAGVVTSLRRHLVNELGLHRRQVTFMGYWKRGRAGA